MEKNNSKARGGDSQLNWVQRKIQIFKKRKPTKAELITESKNAEYTCLQMNDDIHNKTESAGAEGVDFQLNLLLTTLLRAEKEYGDDFRIYSAWDKAGKFDDLVLTFKDHHHHLLQAKHVIDEQKTITYEDLISGDKFCIEKYFNSFKEIEKTFNGQIVDLILFSNLALNENVLPFVDAIPSKHHIFHYQENKKDGKVPVMHKLNSKFIEDYQYSKLRRIARTFLDYCIKGIAMKATNNAFKDCHVILSTDVVNVTKCKFRDEFIDGKALSVETQQFRATLLEELEAKDKAFSSAETQTEWLRSIRMKFASDFGSFSSKKEAANIWPIALTTPQDVELFKNFCKFFILASSQPNNEELTGYVETEYKYRLTKSQAPYATGFLQNELRDWYNTKGSAPLNSKFLKDALKYIKKYEKELKFINETERYIQALSPLQLDFESIPYENQIGIFLQQNESSVLHIETNGIMTVSLMKLFCCLQKLQFPKYFFSPETELSRMIDLLGVFGDSQTFNILITELQGINKPPEVMAKLQNFIQNDKPKRKKIIVVTKKGEEPFFPTPLFVTVEDATYFEQLKARSRLLLLDRSVTFQGTEIALNSILSNGIPLKHQDLQSWGCLIEETISINSKRDDIDLGHYINRTLHCECPYFDKSSIQEKLGDQHTVTYNVADFNTELQLQSKQHAHLLEELNGKWCWRTSKSGLRELLEHKKGTNQLKINDQDDNFLEHVKETLIVSDTAGNGKTSITSYLATELMKKNRHFWVTHLPSSRCSFTSEEIQLTAASDNIKYDLFLFKKLFDVSTPLERLIFEQYLHEEESQSKLIFIFDGFDEINDESRTVILRALKYLKEKPNVKFIGISTKPHYQKQLEEEMQSRTWTLRPFNEDNKITFLEKFWSSRAATEPCDKMREYAEGLIDSISRSISDEESELTGIPLQVRMIAEIYEENAKEYVAGDNKKRLAVPPIDLFELYDQFNKKKEDVYLNDKLGIVQSAAQRSETITPFQKNQIEFALQIMFSTDADDIYGSGSKSKLPLSKEDLEDCIGLGIIQKSENKQFSFIHRTFAEFLTATYLLDANVSLTDKLNKGQLMKVLAEESFAVVRIFMNSHLSKNKQMLVETTELESEVEIRNIKRRKFIDAIETVLNEENGQVFNFLIELLLFRMKRETGLKSSYVKRHNRIVFKAPIFSWMIINSDNKLILITFEYLLSYVLRNPYGKKLATCLFECQTRLEEDKIILNNKHLKGILWGLNPDADDVLFSFEYFRYLKCNKRDIFYAFLKKKGTIQKVMLHPKRMKFSKIRNGLYRLMEGDSDAHFVFDQFVVGGFGRVPYYYVDQFESYFKFLSRYTRLFDQQRLKRLQLFIEEQSGKKIIDLQKSEILLKFVIEHQDLFSIDEIIQNILIHKNLSLIENCALWGWTDPLKLLLVEIDYEVQSERSRILASIRERHSDEQLMEIARVSASWRIKNSNIHYQFLSNAIKTRDELNLEIFTSWITTEEIFVSFMSDSDLTDEVIEFVDKRCPQYMMKYFIINKDEFISRAGNSELILEILGNVQKINEEEFWELMMLKDRDDVTILHRICWSNKDSLNKWLELLMKKCPNSDYSEHLYTILKPVIDRKGEFKANVQEILLKFSNEINLSF